MVYTTRRIYQVATKCKYTCFICLYTYNTCITEKSSKRVAIFIFSFCISKMNLTLYMAPGNLLPGQLPPDNYPLDNYPLGIYTPGKLSHGHLPRGHLPLDIYPWTFTPRTFIPWTFSPRAFTPNTINRRIISTEHLSNRAFTTWTFTPWHENSHLTSNCSGSKITVTSRKFNFEIFQLNHLQKWKLTDISLIIHDLSKLLQSLWNLVWRLKLV